LGIIPEISSDVQLAAESDRMTFGAKLMQWAATEPSALPSMPFVLAKTLGRVWDSAAKAGLWGMLMTAPKVFRKNAARVGFEPGVEQGDRIFASLLDNPQGLWIGRADENNPMEGIKTPSGKIEIYIPELEEPAKAIDAVQEAQDLQLPEQFPLLLNAGRHMKYNANTLMRNPQWNKDHRACTVAINPVDAESLNLQDGQWVRVTTEAGAEVGELQVTTQVRQGMVLIPHGFGLIYNGKVYGINANRLTKNTHRDPLGTPLHRYVPCRVEGD
jgi:anaerobic selenocysteine-containing dehydrogenase